MRSFKEWLELREVLAATEAPTDSVQLQARSFGYVYPFNDAGGDYMVMFKRTVIPIQDREVTDDAYEISLRGPNEYDLTGKGNWAGVYNGLILAVRKFLEQVRPEGVVFTGYNSSQTVMYETFYRRYLSKSYTKVSDKDYLRNDFLAKAQQDPRLGKVIQWSMNNAQDTLIAARRSKAEVRELRRSHSSKATGNKPEPQMSIPLPQTRPQQTQPDYWRPEWGQYQPPPPRPYRGAMFDDDE